MKRIALAVNLALLVLCAAVPAHATGIALRWMSCEGVANRNFACDKSTGSEMLVGSFEAPPGVNEFTGIQVSLRFVSSNSSLPAWWQFRNSGSCRQSSLAVNLDVSDEYECSDPYEGQAGGGIAAVIPDNSGGAEVIMAIAIPSTQMKPLNAGTRYTAFKLLINHSRSTGASACTGCSTPLCVRFESMRLVQMGQTYDEGNTYGKRRERYTEITQGISGVGGNANVATWQGGAASCVGATSRPASWKQLKDMYRPR